jgi:hypothetical protein
MKPSFIFIVALVVGAATQTQAQDRERVNRQVVEACKTEIQQLCQGQKGREAEQCLRNNESKLSAQCKGALSK